MIDATNGNVKVVGNQGERAVKKIVYYVRDGRQASEEIIEVLREKYKKIDFKPYDATILESNNITEKVGDTEKVGEEIKNKQEEMTVLLLEPFKVNGEYVNTNYTWKQFSETIDSDVTLFVATYDTLKTNCPHPNYINILELPQNLTTLLESSGTTKNFQQYYSDPSAQGDKRDDWLRSQPLSHTYGDKVIEDFINTPGGYYDTLRVICDNIRYVSEQEGGEVGNEEKTQEYKKTIADKFAKLKVLNDKSLRNILPFTTWFDKINGRMNAINLGESGAYGKIKELMKFVKEFQDYIQNKVLSERDWNDLLHTKEDLPRPRVPLDDQIEGIRHDSTVYTFKSELAQFFLLHPFENKRSLDRKEMLNTLQSYNEGALWNKIQDFRETKGDFEFLGKISETTGVGEFLKGKIDSVSDEEKEWLKGQLNNLAISPDRLKKNYTVDALEQWFESALNVLKENGDEILLLKNIPLATGVSEFVSNVHQDVCLYLSLFFGEEFELSAVGNFLSKRIESASDKEKEWLESQFKKIAEKVGDLYEKTYVVADLEKWLADGFEKGDDLKIEDIKSTTGVTASMYDMVNRRISSLQEENNRNEFTIEERDSLLGELSDLVEVLPGNIKKRNY